MNKTQIRARMEAIAREAEALRAKVSQRDAEAMRQFDALMDEFDRLERAHKATETVEAHERADEQRGADAQFAELTARAPFAAYVRAIFGGDGAALEGAARELNDELGAVSQRGGVVVPWGVLQRAATGTDQIDAADNQRPIIQRVFGPSLVPFFGAEPQQVPAGTTELPVITGKGSVVEQLAEGAAPGDDPSAATFDTHALKPKRLTGEMEVTAEALAQVAGLEMALAADTLAEINDVLSGALVAGDGAAPNVSGFVSRIAEPDDPAGMIELAEVINLASSSVDGLYAQREDEIAVLFGVNTYGKIASLFMAQTDNINAPRYLRDLGVDVRVSSKVANGGGTGSAANKAKRQLAVVRRGRRPQQSFVATWGAGPEMVRDPFTKADAGTLRVVWHLLWDAVIATRTAEWRRLLIQHTA